MFEKFINTFEGTIIQNKDNHKELSNVFPNSFFELLDLHGGKTFNNGLYRLHTFKSSINGLQLLDSILEITNLKFIHLDLTGWGVNSV